MSCSPRKFALALVGHGGIGCNVARILSHGFWSGSGVDIHEPTDLAAGHGRRLSSVWPAADAVGSRVRAQPRNGSAAVVVLGFFLAAPSLAVERKVDFNRDIRPILSDKCFSCHGPDEAKREAGLRLDTPDGMIAKLESGGSAVVPGKGAESSLVARIGSTDIDEIMPPPASGRKLTAEQISLLCRWIEQGAEFRGHWSLVPLASPTPPRVTNPRWEANPIDSIVLSRLERDGLQPAPPADKSTLVRRVTLDLTGLPPTTTIHVTSPCGWLAAA